MRHSLTPNDGDMSSRKPRSLTRDAWNHLKQDKQALIGLAIISVNILMAIFAPILAPYDPVQIDPTVAFQGPNLTHLFGTDEYGRDLLSRIIFGARISILVGVISVGFSLITGSILGLISGYFMGVVDAVISRLMDILFAFPALLLALVFLVLLGQGIDRVMLAIGLVYTPSFARIARGAVLAERNKTYIEAARSIGTGDWTILLKHVLPNAAAPLIVQATLSLSYAILSEASLSFLGLGTQPPTPSWGIMLNKGRALMYYSPWLSIWAGLAIMLVVFGFNTLGDGLRDALDPSLRNR